MRTDTEFKTEDGVILRGWHYRPDGGRGPWPTIVMAHGYSAVKEMYLDRFAEVFAAAGLAAIVFDNRNFGASDGQPRQEIDPWQQVADYRDAIDAPRGRRRSDRGLGLQLFRRSRGRPGRDRPADQMRGRAGAAHQRTSQRQALDPSGCRGGRGSDVC
jgi:alpha-beta hydrolase superfamily lysophospholipase